jgi:RNA polymerase sigma factor (sigma-70 family)
VGAAVGIPPARGGWRTPVNERTRPIDADEALMERYRDGDARAFERLYRRHRGPLFRYIKRQCSEPAVAEELFQDVWMKVVRARSRYRVEAKFTTYLYRIAHNRLIDHHRARRLPDGDPLPAAEVAAGAADQPDRRVHSLREVQRLQKLVQSLPDEQREAFLLHQEGGLSVEEIAGITGVGRETAKSRLRYALSKLRQSLRAEHG